MTIKEQIKILGNKIKQNQADCDLYKQNAKISTLSSGQLDKNAFIEYSNTMDDIYMMTLRIMTKREKGRF